MKNIKNFEQFGESLNEGLISWMKRKFNPKEMDSVIGDVIDHIESEFDIDNLEQHVIHSRHGNNIWYTYTTKTGDIILSRNSSLSINDEDVTKHVNKHYIDKLYNSFRKKYDNKEKEEDNKKISKLKNTLSRKYNNDQEENYY